MANGSRLSSKEHSKQSSESALDSWKEIASYVKRDISTVQRWEKREGMPIHRHVHDKRGSVYAFGSELDAWLQSRGSLLNDDEREFTAATTAHVETVEKAIPHGRHWLLVGLTTAIVLLAVAYAIDLSRAGNSIQPGIKSLAVLPLINLSGDPDQQYLVDGLTDELTTDLATLGTVRVISRGSAGHYTDTHTALSQIAKELNIDAVVTGTVERSGNLIRVRTKLVRPGTDEVLWAGGYDRGLGDVLGLEGEVSRDIAHKVGIQLTPQAQQRLERKLALNPEARDAYLRGRYFYDKDTKDGAIKCQQYFQEAIAKDPHYAAAYGGLSRCYGLVFFFNLMPYSELGPKIKAAATKAVELDDNLPDGHAELADYDFEFARDFHAAEQEIKRALTLDPNSEVAHEYYSFFLQRLGREDEAVNEILKARDLDPLSLHVADTLGWTLMDSRRYDEAITQFQNVLRMDPNYRRSMWGLTRTYELKGMYPEAISECLRIPSLPSIDPFAKALFKARCSLYEKVHATSGAQGWNQNWFDGASQEIKDYMSASGDDSYFIATLCAQTGEEEKALAILERMCAQLDGSCIDLKMDPRLDKLRPTPRFQALLARMNFPPQ